jgi:dihydrofolate synthase/folylpolyglutamate synthase
MQYQEFLDHIYQRYSGNVKLELGRMQGLLQDMESPQTKYGGFHVAGTNGKGSVCACLEALALAHGLRTGLNTSPHLINYTERFRIDGQELPFPAILEKFHKYEELFNKWDASFFEITTAIAFSLFAEAGIDLAVMEVGLGGRLDATNLFVPDIAAITTIALDHIKTLGGTVEIIAAEKAGIIKDHVPLVLGDIQGSSLAIIQKVAQARQAPCYLYEQDWKVTASSDSTAGICFDYQFKDYHYLQLKANLMGEHQAINLGQALTAFILYCEKKGIQPDQERIREALGRINWFGRMQVLSLNPTVIIDGAHNVHGVQALVRSLNKVYPDRKLVFVLSILADKNYDEMIRMICTKAEKVYVAQNSSDRAASAEDQQKAVARYQVPAIAFPSVDEAFKAAFDEAGPDSVIVGGGSLFTVGEIISAFRRYV